MKTSHVIASSMVAFLFLFSGCGKKGATGGASSGAGADSEPEMSVAELNKSGDEELAEPNKAEARQWLKGVSHAVFKGDKKEVIKFVEEFYAAGATTVYITGIETLGDTEVTESILLVLPKDAAARAKIFEVANRANEAFGSDPEKDRGQKYISLILD